MACSPRLGRCPGFSPTLNPDHGLLQATRLLAASSGNRRCILAAAPNPGGEFALLVARHVAVDRGGVERGMAEPALHQVRRHRTLKRGDAEGMAQTFRHGRRPAHFAPIGVGSEGSSADAKDLIEAPATVVAKVSVQAYKMGLCIFGDSQVYVQGEQVGTVSGVRYLLRPSPDLLFT